MIRGETSRLSSPHSLAGQAACLSPGGAVSARSPECPEGAGTQGREGAPGRGEEARGALQGVRRGAGSGQDRRLSGHASGCWAQVRQGFPASRVPGLSATRAAQSHSSPRKGVGFRVSFFHPKSQKFKRFHLWHHLLQQRGPVQCRRAQGKPRLPGPPGPCALLGHTPTPGLWAPSSAPLEPRGRCGQLGQEAGRLVCLTFCLHLSGTVGPLFFWSPLGGEMRGPKVSSILRGPETATTLDPQRDEDSCFPEGRGAD